MGFDLRIITIFYLVATNKKKKKEEKSLLLGDVDGKRLELDTVRLKSVTINNMNELSDSLVGV